MVGIAKAMTTRVTKTPQAKTPPLISLLEPQQNFEAALSKQDPIQDHPGSDTDRHAQGELFLVFHDRSLLISDADTRHSVKYRLGTVHLPTQAGIPADHAKYWRGTSRQD